MSSDKKNRIKVRTILMTLLIVIFFYIMFIGVVVYFFPKIDNIVIKKTTQYVPYPSVLVDRNFVSVNKIAYNLDSVRKFYENQDFSQIGLRVDFTTGDGKKRLAIKEKDVLQKLIDNLIIESEANKRGIKITSSIIDQAVERKLKEYGTEEYLKQNMQKLYGWDIEDFKENIVKPDLYREKLAENIRKNDPASVTAKNKLIEAEKKIKDGGNFSDLAKEYSEGESAKDGGSLGWFNANQMLPEVAKNAFILEKNQLSEIIESPIGYHIIKIDDKKTDNGVEMLKLSQIFVRTESFPEWLRRIEKDHKIFVLNKEYIWNKTESNVEFRDESMKKYEENLLKNSTNDPSIIF